MRLDGPDSSLAKGAEQLLLLDFAYLPIEDVDEAAADYVRLLEGELLWRVRGLGTTVACVRLPGVGPLMLLSGHLEGATPILIYRVADYAAAVERLRAAGASGLRELEIPQGPCASFQLPSGQRFAVYELVRPGVDRHFEGRFDA